MTDKRRDDSRLDAAIDRAVRDIMRAEPRAGLRERVLAELAGEPARAAWWPRLAFTSAAVAVAAIVLLLVVNRPAEPPVDQRVAVATPSAAAPANRSEPVEPPREAPLPRVDRPRSRPAARSVGVEDRPVQAASIETGESIAPEPMAVERLAPIDPIRIPRLDAPAAAEANITPITIERIEITPLTPRR